MDKDKGKHKLGRDLKMLTKEIARKNNEGIELSPVEKALKDFRENNGYGFLDMINNEKTRKKHHLKQHQVPSYDDDDFLKEFQHKQGE